MSENKKVSCNLKCVTCEHYENVTDYCKEHKIEDCSKKTPTDFSTCNDYIIKENLVMF